MRNELHDDLENINKRLRGNVTMESVIKTTGRCVELTRIYHNGSSDLFVVFIEECHPRYSLIHVKDVKVNRQDVVCEVAGPTCMNRQYCVEFLAWCLKSEDKGSRLEENLFICVSSLPMVTIYRLMSIFYLTIFVTMRLISGNSHKLAEFGWSV